jgi:sugar/nucleoside kinase (ribokinase family)
LDLVVAGAPCLDITFQGVEGMPVPGEERYGDSCAIGAGGCAITAIAAARQGLRTALAWPLGRDWAAALLNEILEAEGVVQIGTPAAATAITVVIPVGGERALVSSVPPGYATHITAEDRSRVQTAARQARAVIRSLEHEIPAEIVEALNAASQRFATLGHGASERFARHGPPALGGYRALLLNQAEALRIAGLEDRPEVACATGAEGSAAAAAAAADEAFAAAREIVRRTGVEEVVVTLGTRGALVVSGPDDPGLQLPAPSVVVSDSTGAGDRFAAAWVAADLRGSDRSARLSYAVRYATQTVTAPAADAQV